MNERIKAIEAAVKIIQTAKIEAMKDCNDLGFEILYRVGVRLKDEMRAMIAEQFNV